MWIVILLYLFIVSTLISLVLIPFVKRLAFRYNILDKPGGRKNHDSAIPYLGGAAIFISFSGVILLHLFLYKFLPEMHRSNVLSDFISNNLLLIKHVLSKVFAILSGGAIIFITGLLDDFLGERFSIYWKITGQVLAAMVVVFMGISIVFMPWDWLDVTISILWIFLITNAFNLLDNMDGLSAGIGCITAVIFFIIAVGQGQFFIAAILTVFVGSVLGFLWYNIHPASIFMGDAGSQFIGFILGTLTISASYVTDDSPSLLPILMPLLILIIPLFDTLSVVAIRFIEKRPIYIGDQSHLSHRLVSLGFSRRGAVLFIYLLTLITGLAAMLLPSLQITESIIIFVQTVALLIMVSILMHIGNRNNKGR